MSRHRETADQLPACIAAPRRAVALASATGIRLRGFHSNNSSSTASSTAASGAANVADMPAAAPATSSVLRSTLVKWKNCAIIDPNAPPVMMMGPSAPNGPPLPMEMADDSGFRMASRGCHAAAIDQDRFDRFWNAVSADSFRAVSRHQSDDQRAADRHQNRPDAQMIAGWRDQRGVPAAEIEQIGEKTDQPQQRPGHNGADQADGDGKQRNRNHPPVGGEIAQFVRASDVRASCGASCDARQSNAKLWKGADRRFPVPGDAPTKASSECWRRTGVR